VKLFDEKGLFLVVNPTGGRWWRFKYRHEGREKLLSLGTFPEVPLEKARKRRDAARQLVADGIDPSVARQSEKTAEDDSFKAVAEEWLAQQAKTLAPESIARIRDRMEDWIYGAVGSRPVRKVSPQDLLAALRRIEERGRHETAHRARADCSRILRYAVATGRAERDVTVDLRGALAPVKTTHFAAITDPAEVGALLRAIDGYQGQPITALALRLAPLVFVRPGELRGADWSEFNLEAAEWRIPAERMKMGRPHIVPLARQTLALLRELQIHSGDEGLLFPTIMDATRPMSANTLNSALRRLGYSSKEMTAHGFRSLASTLLNEQGFHPDLIELQLAHQEQNATRAAYNRAERLADRRQMMQAWADYLDRLRAAREVPG
jgi:integrase